MVRTQYRCRCPQVSSCTAPMSKLTTRTLGNSFPLGGLAVATATDSIIYKSDVIAASRLRAEGWAEDDAKRTSSSSGAWGSKAVLVLIGMRLGLDGVNPIYYDSVKVS